MNITWVTRVFLDYRVPLFTELDHLSGHRLRVIFNGDLTPDRVVHKVSDALGDNAIALHGEKNYGEQSISKHMANTTYNVPIQWGLQKAIRSTKPDIIICDGFFQWSFAVLWYRLFHRIPVIMCYEKTCHTERNCPWPRTLYRKITAAFFSNICCNGRLSAEYIRKLGVPNNKISLGHMCSDVNAMRKFTDKITDADCLELKKQYGLSGPVFLFVGSLIPLKGIRELLDVFQDFRRRHDEVSLIIAGEGELKEELKAGNIPGVCFVGNFPYDRIPLLYKVADVFIMPTLEDNWSLVVPEAMTNDLPIACSIYNGCHDELVTPENGWLFDPLDYDNTINILEMIIRQKENWKKMGRRSWEIVQNFTPAICAQNVYRVCCELTGEEVPLNSHPADSRN